MCDHNITISGEEACLICGDRKAPVNYNMLDTFFPYSPVTCTDCCKSFFPGSPNDDLNSCQCLKEHAKRMVNV